MASSRQAKFASPIINASEIVLPLEAYFEHIELIFNFSSLFSQITALSFGLSQFQAQFVILGNLRISLYEMLSLRSFQLASFLTLSGSSRLLERAGLSDFILFEASSWLNISGWLAGTCHSGSSSSGSGRFYRSGGRRGDGTRSWCGCSRWFCDRLDLT